jgi:Cu/Ag efflux protein CusF
MNMTMERLTIAGAMGLALLSGCAKNEGPKPMPPSVVTERSRANGTISRTDTVTMEAKVVGINQKKREVTLQGADGEKKTIEVGDEVKNLPQVHKGDMVTVAYHRAIAATLKKKGKAKPGSSSAQEVLTAKPGEMPAAIGAHTTKVTATVTNLDRKTQEITLKGPKGRSVVVAVEDPTVLDKVKTGDLVEITYTEAVAIAVDKPRS